MPSSWRRFEVLLPLQFNDGLEESRQWMRDYKQRWKARLEQLDLWLVSYPIEID